MLKQARRRRFYSNNNMTPLSSPEPEKKEKENDENFSPKLTLHSHVEVHPLPKQVV